MIIPTHDNLRSPRSIDQKINELATERTSKVLQSFVSDLERIKVRMETTYRSHRADLLDLPDLEMLIKRQVRDLGDILQKMTGMIE